MILMFKWCLLNYHVPYLNLRDREREREARFNCCYKHALYSIIQLDLYP
jgi:hypothetical protein